MNKLPVYYPGSSMTVMFRVRNRKNVIPLDDYHVEAAFYTRIFGRKIYASDLDPEKIAIEWMDGEVLKVVIPAGETQKLACGECSVKLTFTHKKDGSKMIASRKIFTLKETIKDE